MPELSMTRHELFERACDLIAQAEAYVSADPSRSHALATLASAHFTGAASAASLGLAGRLEESMPAAAPERAAPAPELAARFGIVIDIDGPGHVRFRLYSATVGQHMGLNGGLTMTRAEFDAFRANLGPLLTDRSGPPAAEPTIGGDPQ